MTALSPEVLDIEIYGDFKGTLRDFFKELALKVRRRERCIEPGGLSAAS